MKIGRLVAGALALLLGCGGEARDPQKGVGGASDDGVGTSDDGVGGTAGNGMGGGAGVLGFIPDGPVSRDGDGSLTGGGFDGNPGDGWDLCPTRTAGRTWQRVEGAAQSDEAFLRFSSALSCHDTAPCSSDGSESQIAFWLDAAVSTGEPIHLYFDVKSYAPRDAAGTLQLLRVGDSCETEEQLVNVRLVELRITESWQTRCVRLQASGDTSTLGLLVTGERYDIGLDTFRIGPPCH